MDVPEGQCWRCERILSEKNITCAICKIAQYCCGRCQVDDKYRHGPECEVWGPKKCGNNGCHATGFLKEVSVEGTWVVSSHAVSLLCVVLY